MIYRAGDCLILPALHSGFVVVYVAGDNEQDYYLAFLDFQGITPPSPVYFETCSFVVSTFGPPEQAHAAFETVTISKTLLDHAFEVSRIAHLDLGTLGQMGLTPMAEVADIAAFFEEHFANLAAKPDQETFQPFKRSMMPIEEVRKRANPVNPFPTVKRYKRDGQVTRFWHIYGSPVPATIITCWGPVGHYEGYEEIKDEHLDTLKATYRSLIEEKTTEGYEDWQNHKEMILQFQTNDGWGNLDDLAFRNQIWDNLNEQLFWSGNGEVSGGDIGSGTINLFFRAISPGLAVTLISALLEAKQIHRPYLIAIAGDDSAGDGVKVIYPTDYAGEFNY